MAVVPASLLQPARGDCSAGNAGKHYPILQVSVISIPSFHKPGPSSRLCKATSGYHTRLFSICRLGCFKGASFSDFAEALGNPNTYYIAHCVVPNPCKANTLGLSCPREDMRQVTDLPLRSNPCSQRIVKHMCTRKTFSLWLSHMLHSITQQRPFVIAPCRKHMKGCPF